MTRLAPLLLAVLAGIGAGAAAGTSTAQAPTAQVAQDTSATPPRDLELVSFKAPAVPKLSVDGSAVVAFTIRANGRVDDALTLATSDRVLGDSAREAVLQWRFESDPVLGHGRDANPSLVVRRQLIEFVFKRGGVVESVSHYDSGKYWFPPEQASPIKLVQGTEFGSPLLRISTPTSAKVTKLVADLVVGGVVVVSFVVDEAGTVRLPVVEGTQDPTLIETALAFVADWRFGPPTLEGRPVLVEQRNALTFNPRHRESLAQ